MNALDGKKCTAFVHCFCLQMEHVFFYFELVYCTISMFAARALKKNHGAGSLHMNRYRGVLHNRAKTSVNIMMSRSCVTLSDLVTSVSFPPTHPLHLEFFPEPGEIDDAVKKIANIMFICVPRNCDDVRHNIVCKLN